MEEEMATHSDLALENPVNRGVWQPADTTGDLAGAQVVITLFRLGDD